MEHIILNVDGKDLNFTLCDELLAIENDNVIHDVYASVEMVSKFNCIGQMRAVLSSDKTQVVTKSYPLMPLDDGNFDLINMNEFNKWKKIVPLVLERVSHE